ncbi:hypothetical protein Anas_09338 [Armadillidium nasatum]|uniref:Uncharacterized protein n=1 Tax=Armadillidium nasatum TaxID=96803 RepID=A0A5N5T8C9_9CRUS|nr:hypothetical protein Anas_09338 [Armadillidium nasatum]
MGTSVRKRQKKQTCSWRTMANVRKKQKVKLRASSRIF